MVLYELASMDRVTLFYVAMYSKLLQIITYYCNETYWELAWNSAYIRGKIVSIMSILSFPIVND